jgi:hypothetical protein
MKPGTIAIFALALAWAGAFPIAGPGAGPVPAAYAQTDDISAAQALYDESRFSQAMELLQDGLLTGRIAGGQVVRARELLARCQVKAGDADGARRTFLAMLREDPLYRPDAVRVPPDEMEVYAQARRAFDDERERAAQRIPASIELHYGTGSGANEDFGEFVAAGGGDDAYDVDRHFGGVVRFPVAPRLSVDIMIQRFRATNADSFSTGGARYQITAIPVALSLSWLMVDGPRFRGFVFGGGGPMLEATSSVSFPFFGIPIQIADDKPGVYLHAGIEGEYRVHPRFSVVGRLLGRSAKATGLFEDTDFEPYTSGVSIADRDVDFSGVAALIGVRAYVGY